MTNQELKKSTFEDKSTTITACTTIENEDINIKNINMKPLNNENTFSHRECQEILERSYRKESFCRNDVKQTTDIKAFDEMYEYIKSDSVTLDTHHESKIAKFYKGRSVFITGASGFVGKVGIYC